MIHRGYLTLMKLFCSKYMSKIKLYSSEDEDRKDENFSSFLKYTVFLNDDYSSWAYSYGSPEEVLGKSHSAYPSEQLWECIRYSAGKYIESSKEEDKDVCYLSSPSGLHFFWDMYERHIKRYLGERKKRKTDYQFRYRSLNGIYKKGKTATIHNSFLSIEIYFFKDCFVKRDNSEERPWFRYTFDFDEARIVSDEEKKKKALRLEECCRDYFIGEKWTAKCTNKSNDFGADVLAFRNDYSVVVQCKAHKKQVGVDAVQQAFTAAYYYKANFPVVISQHSFSHNAIILARHTNTVLLSWDNLEELIPILRNMAKNGFYINHNEPFRYEKWQFIESF